MLYGWPDRQRSMLMPITLCMTGFCIKLLSSCVSSWCVNKLFHESNLPLRSKGAGMKRLRKALGKQPFRREKFNMIEVTCTCNNYWPEKQNMSYRPRRNLRQVWSVRVDQESHYNPSRTATGATVSQQVQAEAELRARQGFRGWAQIRSRAETTDHSRKLASAIVCRWRRSGHVTRSSAWLIPHILLK